MIKTECCAFCGKKINNENEINGEHLFPAFACKRAFGDSKASKLLQEGLKVSVCKKCNTKYGEILESRLSRIIDGLNGNIPRYAFRTEEALCVLDFIDKTRVLLQHYMSPEVQDLVCVGSSSQILPCGRQVFILRAEVPDGVYIKQFDTEETKLVKEYLGQIPSKCSVLNFDTIAVCIDNIAIIGMSNMFVNQQLGFPVIMVDPYNPNAARLLQGTHTIDTDVLLEIPNKAGSVTEHDFGKGFITLAQPGAIQFNEEAEKCGIIGKYEKSHQLTMPHNDYIYGVYFESGVRNGWLLKSAMERGAKGVAFDLSNVYPYEDFSVLFDQASKYGLLYHIIASGHFHFQTIEDIRVLDKEIRQGHWHHVNVVEALEHLVKKHGYDKAKKIINVMNLPLYVHLSGSMHSIYSSEKSS